MVLQLPMSTSIGRTPLDYTRTCLHIAVCVSHPLSSPLSVHIYTHPVYFFELDYGSHSVELTGPRRTRARPEPITPTIGSSSDPASAACPGLPWPMLRLPSPFPTHSKSGSRSLDTLPIRPLAMYGLIPLPSLSLLPRTARSRRCGDDDRALCRALGSGCSHVLAHHRRGEWLFAV
jgi:hypothetical protein